ncbi:NADP-dependent oxidoreductase [Catenulispora pinisilvae]|uniref:NADP-dependent oxidoreductase n=1 Tax=Catenulispora pinisilvae TaxID=2705253 RepID=UPI0018922033|nr:NADP-dependent oxidoreductase [Catenulispora pinisilvae]
MRAIAVPEIGGTPALVDLPVPSPGPGEVLVRLATASLNPIDSDIAEGRMHQLPSASPLILGTDGAGRVTEVGESVTGFAVGDLVHGQFLDVPVGRGTYAEYAVIAEVPSHGALQHTPDGVSADVAAALPTAGMTGLGIVEALDLGPGDTILITGATGGVGVFAVQFAAARGAEVIATARPDAQARIRDLGASQTIDYTRDDVAEAVRKSHPDGIHAFLDLTRDAPRFSEYAALVRDGGAAASATFTAPPELLASERITVTNFMMDDKPGLLARITEEVRSGRITVPIGRTITLDQVPESLGQNTGGGARGKTVVRI